MRTVMSLTLAMTVATHLIAASQPDDQAWRSLDGLREATIVVRQESDEEVTGRLMSTSAGSLVIAVKRGEQVVSRDRICEVTVRNRDRSRTIGWVVGLTLAGLALGIVNTHVYERAVSPALPAAIGGGIGALIGASPSERTVYRGRSSCARK